MPTYVYRCPACGHEFEKFHKMTVTTRPKCPRCGKTAERTITGGAGLLFKGSGFYITDYKKAPKGQEGQKGTETAKPDQSDKADKADKTDKADKADKPAPGKPRDEH